MATFSSRPFYLCKVIDIEFRDTLKLIPTSLSNFGEMFKLPQKKEVMPYALFTKQFVERGGWATWEEIQENAHDFYDFDQLWLNLHEWECVCIGAEGTKQFDMLRYSDLYCKADVEVLRQGTTPL